MRFFIAFISATLILFSAVSISVAATPGYEEIRKALASGIPTVVDIGADYCPPCIKMKPILAELKEELAGKVNIIVIDADKESVLADRLKVRSIPTQMFYDAKGKKRDQHIGFMSRKQILAAIEKL